MVQESFEKAKRWLNELYKAGSSNMVIVLVGNKHDLPEREVEEEVCTTTPLSCTIQLSITLLPPVLSLALRAESAVASLGEYPLDGRG